MTHPWHEVDPQINLPEEFRAIVEIPMGSQNKYELDKKTGLLKVDRVLHSAVFYPANYGFIPRTYADDDDPLDVLVLGQEPIHPMCLVDCRAIGLMTMRDQNALDHKVIAVHTHDPEFNFYHDIAQLPTHKLALLRRFFQDYKALEGKEVVVDRYRDRFEAHDVIIKSLEMYKILKAKNGQEGGGAPPAGRSLIPTWPSVMVNGPDVAADE